MNKLNMFSTPHHSQLLPTAGLATSGHSGNLGTSISIEKLNLVETLARLQAEASLDGLKFSLEGQDPRNIWINLRKVQERTTVRSVRNEKFEDNSIDLDSGLQIEVWCNGHFAYVGTPEANYSEIKRAFKRALHIVQNSQSHKVFNFDSRVRPVAKGNYSTAIKDSLASQVSQAQVFDFLMSASQAMKVSSEIETRTAYSMLIETQFDQVSSSGTQISQEFSIHNTSLTATAFKNGEHQTRSDKGGLARCLQGGSELFSTAQLKERCQRIAEQALELIHAPNCPTEIADLLLAPDQMILQIHESIGHPLELDRILGDERNYAGWSFVKPEDFGKLQYGSSLMNVVFDPMVPGELASYAFDDHGNPATREFLIKDGVLLRGLGSLESQVRLNVPGVANARSASWNRAPIDRMANINLLPGQSSLEEMIGSIQKGVIMEANRSWSIDDYRNKFQFGCEYGLYVENGRVKNVVKNPNYRGQTSTFWKNLAQVGKAEQVELLGSPYCGKGEPNQVIRVGHSSPYCLFKNIEIFGGG